MKEREKFPLVCMRYWYTWCSRCMSAQLRGGSVQCAKCKQRKLSLQRPVTTPCLKKNTRKLFPLFTVPNMPNNVNFSRYSNKNDTGRNFYQKIFVNIWQAGTRYYTYEHEQLCVVESNLFYIVPLWNIILLCLQFSL